MTIAGFADIRHALSSLPSFDQEAALAARSRQQQLTKPPGSLGRLEEIAVWLAGWQGKDRPHIKRPQVVIFAGNHGVIDQGISAYPGSVTAQMVANFSAGGAAINQLCTLHGIALSVIPLDLDKPTLDFTHAPAMSEAECMDAIRRGQDAVSKDCDLLILGEMGIGNTTAAAAMICALLERSGSDIAGPGTGLTAEGVARKAAVIDRALAHHLESLNDPLRVLQCLGGREITALFGAMFSARTRRIPVLLDGFVVTAAACVLRKLHAQAATHCLAGHLSAEPAHTLALKYLELVPLLNLEMRLGEASGAAVAYPILQAALATHNGMATFASAGISGKAG